MTNTTDKVPVKPQVVFTVCNPLLHFRAHGTSA